MSVLEFEVSDHIATVTLNRPEARNALDPELIVELDRTWQRVMTDDDIWVVLVAAAEGSTFCSGFDLRTTIPIMTGARRPENDFEQAVADDPELMARAGLRQLDLGRPAIAAVSGHAIAGGFELMLACDLRVAATDIRLGLSEVKLGLIPGMGGTARLGRLLPPALASEMLLTGDPITSAQALTVGLVNRVVPPEQVLSEARALAETVAANPPLAVRAAREVLRRSADLTEAESLALEKQQVDVLATTEDAKEGPAAFMEKRPPVFKGR